MYDRWARQVGGQPVIQPKAGAVKSVRDRIIKLLVDVRVDATHQTEARAPLMETLGERWTADGGQRALLSISTRRGLITRLSYSNSYPARRLLANKKWGHVAARKWY